MGIAKILAKFNSRSYFKKKKKKKKKTPSPITLFKYIKMEDSLNKMVSFIPRAGSI